MEKGGKSLAIPCTSRGTLEKLYPVGIQVFIDAAASPVPSKSVHGAPGPSPQLVPPGFLHHQWRKHLRKTLREVHKVGKFLMLIKNLLRFKCLLFLPSKNLFFQPPPPKSWMEFSVISPKPSVLQTWGGFSLPKSRMWGLTSVNSIAFKGNPFLRFTAVHFLLDCFVFIWC